MSRPLLLVLGGPTASGKTDLAIKLANRFDTEIISADSRQFYTKLDIGTAKPSQAELAAAKHHLVDFLEPDAFYSAGEFERDVLGLLDQAFKEKDIMILAGGSGMYIRAVCEGFDEFPEVDPEIRAELHRKYLEFGLESLQDELAKSDPKYFTEVDIQNPQRLMRALEVCRASGKPYSSFRKKEPKQRPFDILKIGLNPERRQLYDRIDQRVDQMVEMGLEEEVRSLLAYRDDNAFHSVGYREWLPYIDGKCSKQDAIDRIKKNSRNFAKRQMTWFRREKDMHWFQTDQLEEIIQLIEQKSKAL